MVCWMYRKKSQKKQKGWCLYGKKAYAIHIFFSFSQFLIPLSKLELYNWGGYKSQIEKGEDSYDYCS